MTEPMTDLILSLRRRQLLAGGAGALAGTGLMGLAGGTAAQTASAPAAPKLPAYAAWKDADAVIVHNPNELETKRSAFGTSAITSSDRLYVRNNVTPPDPSILADRNGWQVAIDGVRNPRTLSVAELKTIGVETVATVLQCSGNGRAFFPHKPSGAKWSVGASGCVIWSGAPVRYVVEALGGVGPGHALPHRHRRRNVSRRHRSDDRDGRTLAADRSAERRAARVGDERRADLARPRRPAAPDRSGLPGRQQHQVRQAGRLDRGRIVSGDPEDALSAERRSAPRRPRPIRRCSA